MEEDEFFNYHGSGAKPKVPCYRVNQTRLKSELKAKYPFLSDDQISRRAKQEWDKMMGHTPKHKKKLLRKTCNKDVCSKIFDKNKGRQKTNEDYKSFEYDFFKQEPEHFPNSTKKSGESSTYDTVFDAYCSNRIMDKMECTYTREEELESSNTSDDDSDDNVLIRREDAEFTSYLGENSQNNSVEQTDTGEFGNNKMQKLRKRTKSGETDNTEINKSTKKARLCGFEVNISDALIDRDKSSVSSIDSNPSQTSNDTDRKSTGKNKPRVVRKSTRTPGIHTQDSTFVSIETPALLSKDMVIDENTPQLDGALQTTILNKINKTPKKKNKQRCGMFKSNSQKPESKGAACKKVTKSLIPETLNNRNKVDSNVIQDKNKRSKINVDKSSEVHKTMPESTVSLSVEKARSLDKALLLQMNPSGDAIGIGMVESENRNIAEQLESCNENDSVCMEKGIQPSRHAVGHFRDFTKSKLFLPDAESYSSSQSSFSSEYSMNVACKQQENPALLQSLNNLQMCVTSADKESDMSSSEHSGLFSPRLLSPALSGLSEITSTTSGSSHTDITDNIVPDIQMNQLKAMHTPTDSGLCQLFKDVTPPERKTSGEFKTKRILASEGGDRNDKFKQLFDQDEDFLFP